MELSSALGSVLELKGSVANALRQSGFTDVVHTEGEVAGNRNAVRLSVIYLPIAGRSFWQVVMAAGDAADITNGAVNEIVTKIRQLAFL
jgi:hypothetical protein